MPIDVKAVSTYSRRFVRVTLAFSLIAVYLAFSRPDSGERAGYAQAGLVAAYGFDEGAGSAALDASGNGNHGTIAGAIWTPASRFGTALSFDGLNDLVTIADAATLDLTTAFTIEAWVRPTASSGIRTVLMKEDTGELAYALYANDEGGRPTAEVRTTTSGSRDVVSTVRIPTGSWTHLAATYDGTGLRLYLNGSLIRVRFVTGSVPPTVRPLRIGGNLIWGQYFQGQIDEVRVYSRALSASEIQDDMDTPVTTTTPPPPDTTPPTVSVTAPVDGATLAQTVTISADAADDTAVAGVQFFVDSLPVGVEDATAPYSVAVDTQSITNGPHTLSARARDTSGNTTDSAAVAVIVDNPARLVITQPANGATLTGTTVAVAYTTTGDLTGVDHVHFVLDGGGEMMDGSFDGVFQLSNVTPGSHTLAGFLVRADHTKIAGTDAVPVSFTVTVPDQTAPAVGIASPTEGSTVQGTISVQANASDDVAVVGVQFFLDGATLGTEDTVPPYAAIWDSTTAANGSHTLTARARDAAGNSAVSVPVTVTVSNTGGPAETGEWSAPFPLPVVAVHQALMPTGRVLMWDAGDLTASPPHLWDPATGALTPAPQNATDLFCSGHTLMADGRLLTLGGDTRTTGLGVVDVNRFDPFTSTWTRMAPMSARRWYPTGITLDDGRVLVMGGYGDCYSPTCLVGQLEMYDPASNVWTSLPASADHITPSYPFLFSLPNRRVLLAGSYEGTIDTRILDLNTSTWSVVDPIRIDAGSAVMYAPGKVMKAGKWANADAPFGPAHSNTYVIDVNQALPTWRPTAPMNSPRAYPVLTLLPDGTTLATGGSQSTDPGDISQAVLEAEIWSPDTETWTTGARMQNGRLYHGSAMLLPDGRVLVAGSGRYGSPEQENGEIYSPPYLFKGPRPVIGDAPTVVQPGSVFNVITPNIDDIVAVTMIRTGAMTHSFNSDQRFVKLTFTPGEGGLIVHAPSDTGIAPPGYYLLFLINSKGIPSVGKFVRIPTSLGDTVPPSAPAAINVFVGGVGTVSVSWPASSDNVAVAGYDIHRSTTPGLIPSAANRVGQTNLTSFTDTGLSAGTYFYRVVARDAAGNVSAPSPEAAAAIATTDTQVPTVAITAPPAGTTLSGTVTLSADAADDVGVAGVRFLVDGTQIGAEDTLAPYAVQWNTVLSANGDHQITAIARDASGNSSTSAAIPVAVSNVVVQTGLVVALSFNEGAGTAAADTSGQNNSGSVNSAAWTAGRFGSGLQFNGASSWVTVADAASLDLTQGMTMSAWVRPSSLADWRTIILKERAPGLAYALYAADGGGRPPSTYINVGGGDLSAMAPSMLPLNVWTHVAATYNGSDLRIYVNGALASTSVIGGSILTSSGPLRIGGNSVWGEFFAGAIDEVRVYNRALTQIEIQTDMNTPLQ